MLIGISIIAFTFMNLAPGDPVSAMIDPQQGTGLDTAALRERLGLISRAGALCLWLSRSRAGQLRLLVHQRPTGAAADRRAHSGDLELMSVALVLSTVAGCALGIGSALKRYSPGTTA